MDEQIREELKKDLESTMLAQALVMLMRTILTHDKLNAEKDMVEFKKECSERADAFLGKVEAAWKAKEALSKSAAA